MSGPSSFALVFEGILLLPVSFTGVLVNIFNIWFLAKERSRINFTPLFVNLLIALAAFDLLFLVVEIGIFGFPAVSNWYTTNVYFKILPTWFGFANIGRVGSVALTVSITIERYFSVCFPNNTFSAKSLLLPLPIIFAVLYNIPKFFEIVACDADAQNDSHGVLYDEETTLGYNESVENLIQNATQTECDNNWLRATPLRKNRWYIIVYTVLSKLLLVEVLPWVTVIILNYSIMRKIREFEAIRGRILANNPNQGRASQQTRILLGLVLVFIFCQSFSIVAEIYEFVCIITDANGGATFCESNMHIENFIDVSHFMLAVNASVNFIFYMANIPQFREAFIKIICPCATTSSNGTAKDNYTANGQNIQMQTLGTNV